MTSSKKVQSGQVISSTVLHEMPVSVCVDVLHIWS